MNPIDVEGAEPFVDDLGELRRKRRFLDVVVPEQQINGVRLAGLDLLPNSARSS
jgi:hypothetical protein